MRGKWLLAGFAIAAMWPVVVLLVGGLREAKPQEQYAEWIALKRVPPPPSSIESWANSLGIGSLRQHRMSAHISLVKSLLESRDYSLTVASWLDSDTRSGHYPATWPFLQASLAELLRDPKGGHLANVLLRVDQEGAESWQMTIARSAFLSGCLAELEPLLEKLRAIGEQGGVDLASVKTLAELQRCFTLPEPDLARELLGSGSGSEREEVLLSIMAVRGVRAETALASLISEWKKGPISDSEWRIAMMFTRQPRVVRIRDEFFLWLMLAPEGESLRAGRISDIAAVLNDLSVSDPEAAKRLISEAILEIREKPKNYLSNRQGILEVLRKVVLEKSDSNDLISSEASSDFIWLCHLSDDEASLVRAIRRWGDSITGDFTWVPSFVDMGHYAAACALIEARPRMIAHVDSLKTPRRIVQPGGFSEYLELISSITDHATSSYTKGFVHLVVALDALENPGNKADRDMIESEVGKAIEFLEQAETTNESMLLQAVFHLSDHDKAIFDLGRPCFEKWSNGVTVDDFLSRVFHGGRKLDWIENYIWTRYAREFAEIQELRGFQRIIEEALRSPGSLSSTVEGFDRIRKVLSINPLGNWTYVSGIGSGVQSGGMEFVAWLLQRMIRSGEIESSARWMFDRLRDYRTVFPEEDPSLVAHEIHEELQDGFADIPLPNCIKWLGLVMDERNSSGYAWPHNMIPYISRSHQLEPREVFSLLQAAFHDHPRRVWIVRELLTCANLGVVGRMTDREKADMVGAIGAPWLLAPMEDNIKHTFDIDSFERDMAGAPAEARRFFFNCKVVQLSFLPKIRNRTGRRLSEEEKFRYLLWEGEQIIELAEQRRSFFIHRFDGIFIPLLNAANQHGDSERFRSLIRRFLNVSFNEPRGGISDDELKRLRDLQATVIDLTQ